MANKILNISLIIILLISISTLFYFNTQQTFLSQSTFRTDGDKNYWVINAVADSIDEKTSFISELPSPEELSDGSTITPKSALTLTVSKADEKCEYLAYQQTREIRGGFYTYDILYYTLSSPERVVNFIVSDDRGNTETFDGTIQQSKVFTDIDNDGEAIVQSVGILSTKTDCPSGSDVVIIKADENTFLTTDKQVEVLDKSDFIASVEDNQAFFNTLSDFEVVDNYAFIRDFANGEIIFTGSKLIGTGRNIGNAQFVISADADYFNSVIITPSVPAIPKILKIDIADDIIRNTVSSMVISIENQEDIEGKAFISITSDYASFTPSAEAFTIDEKKVFYTNIKVKDLEKADADIQVKVCGISQFTTAQCDTETIKFNIVGKDTKVETCGDRICQVYESQTTCSVDCLEPEFEETTCKWYQDSYIATELDYGRAYWRIYIPYVEPEERIKAGCQTAGWFYFTLMGIFITLIIALLYFVPNGGKKRK